MLLLLVSCFLKLCNGQSNTTKEIQEKIGIGSWYEKNNFDLITGSYSKIGKKENELIMSLHYAREKNTHEIFGAVAFIIPSSKKETIFINFPTHFILKKIGIGYGLEHLK